MISYLGVSNFKVFDEVGIALVLRPISVLLGGNSSGKTSIIQALKILAEASRISPLLSRFAPVGYGYDIGSFRHALHRHQGDECTFYLGIATERHPEAEVGGYEDVYRPRHWVMGFTYHDPGDGQGHLREVRMYPFTAAAKAALGGASCAAFRVEPGTLREGHDLEFIPIPSSGGAAVSGQCPDWLSNWVAQSEDSSSTTPEEVFIRVAYSAVNDSFVAEDRKVRTASEGADAKHARVCSLLLQALVEVREELKKVRFLGPLRERAPRVPFTDRRPATGAKEPPVLGPNGEGLATLLSVLDEEAMNEMLAQVGLGHLTLSIHRVDGVAGTLQEVVLEDRHLGIRQHLQDVGTGISQVLPVLALLEDLSSVDWDDRGTLVVQQPELHLHPALAGNLARAFGLLDADEGRPMPQTHVIVETHSEHLVRMLGAQVGSPDRDTLRCEHVRIFKLRRLETGTVEADPMDYDEDGHFVGFFPDGFFAEGEEVRERQRERNSEPLRVP